MSGPVRLKIVRGIGLQKTVKIYTLLLSGARGPAGPGLPTGGIIGQITSKISDTVDFLTKWIMPHQAEIIQTGLTIGLNETLELDLKKYGSFFVTITGNNATITFINFEALPQMNYATLYVDNTGGHTGQVITNSETSDVAALDFGTGRAKFQISSFDGTGDIVDVDQVGTNYG